MTSAINLNDFSLSTFTALFGSGGDPQSGSYGVHPNGATVSQPAAPLLLARVGAPALTPPAAPTETVDAGAYIQTMLAASKVMEAALDDDVNGIENELKSQDQKVQQATQARIKKLQEAIQKLADEANAQKSSDIFARIGKVFAAIGAVLGVIASVALTVSTGGAATGLLVVTVMSAVVSLLDVANMISQEKGGPDVTIGGGIAAAVKKAGGSNEQAALGGMISNILVMVALAVSGVGAAKAAEGAGKAVGMVGRLANIGSNTANVVSGVSGVGEGVADLQVAQAQYEGDQLNAEAQSKEAFVTALNKQNERWLSDLKALIDTLDVVLEQVMQRLKDTHTANQTIQNQTTA